MIVLGSGPNRIGQGIEFDYSCVHTVKALRELGLSDLVTQTQRRYLPIMIPPINLF